MQEEEESDGEEAEEDAKAREPKKKTLRPPGYKRPPPAKKPVATADTAVPESEEQEPVPKRVRRTSSEAAAAAAAAAVGVPAERTVGVRESTRQKVQEGEDERKAVEASKPRRPSRPVVHRQLTQAELLAEAARTAIENTRSLQYLVFIEEETKKKANIKKGKYVGPMVRLHSAAVDGEEKTTIEVRNMQAPKYLQAQTASAPPAKPTCVISGKPARYRDPTTGLAYADLAAYKELQARKQQQEAAQAQRQYAQNQYAAAQQQQLQQQQQQQLLLQQQAMMQQRQAAFQQQQFFAQQAAQMAAAAAAAAGGGAPNFFQQ